MLNTENEGIRTAMELIEFDNLTPEERMHAKNKEAGRITIAKNEAITRAATQTDIAKNLIALDADDEFISKVTSLSLERIRELRRGDG
jgi:hypothetical protein